MIQNPGEIIIPNHNWNQFNSKITKPTQINHTTLIFPLSLSEALGGTNLSTIENSDLGFPKLNKGRPGNLVTKKVQIELR